jgi:cytosine/adenosine deaminase-related metal-dependent hydrolase
LININQIGYAGALADPLAALIYSGDSHIVDTTIVNGEVVVEEGKVARVQEEEIIRKANELSLLMLEKASR